MPAVNVNGEIPCRKARKRAADAALEFVARRSLSDGFTNCKRQQIAHA